MLDVLSRIVQEVSATRDLRHALNLMVRHVAEAISVECCSVYLVDHTHKCLTLMSSVGFLDGVAERIHIPFGEGIVGLIAEREEPFNIENAAEHPNFRYFPETGEERYRAFIGVPFIHQKKVLGVLVAQQGKARRFDEGEEAFLITIAAQMAGFIAHAEVSGDLPHYLTPKTSRPEATIVGVPASYGVEIGQALVVYPSVDLETVPDRPISDPDAEIEIFRSALKLARNEVSGLGERMRQVLSPEELSLFDAYAKMLEGASLGEEVEAEIRDKEIWAAAALRNVIGAHLKHFESMPDPYLRERAIDIKDLGRRVLRFLKSKDVADIAYPAKTILVSEELTASVLAEVPEGHLAAVVSVKGSANSHVAILARAMGIPAVLGAENLRVDRIDGREVIVDGYNGELYIEPSDSLKAEFEQLLEEEEELYAGLDELRELRAETPDGHRIGLCVNTGLIADIQPALAAGAEGVGLYRTEVPFLVKARFPTEEEQTDIYRQVMTSFAPKSVTVRTLDVGGDKQLPYFPIHEENPFLGWRGIRITLDHPEIFLVQVRAIFRASRGLNNLRLLLPMVSTLAEVQEAKALIHRAYLEIREEDADLLMPEIGMMIEVPSVLFILPTLLFEVDFISVGSNDLIQYLLAVDRNNPRVANLYDALHPAVLRALIDIVRVAHAHGKPVSICGEMASDPLSVLLLLAMGFDTFSVNASCLPRVKWVVRNFTLSKVKSLLEQALEMTNAEDIRQMLRGAIENAGLGGLIRAGK